VRILLDECIPRKFKLTLSEFEVETVADRGWSGILNGKLLALAATDYDVFITIDKNLQYQQPLEQFDIVVIVISASSNTLQGITEHSEQLLTVLHHPFERKLYVV
jgi:hypothetical protein